MENMEIEKDIDNAIDNDIDNDIDVINIEHKKAYTREKNFEAENAKVRENTIRVQRFNDLFIPTALYATFFSLCLYNNISGILMPVFSIATCLYCISILRKWKIEIKKLSVFGMVVIVLLGLSSCLTGNDCIQTLNFFGIFILLLYLLIHSFYDDGKWGFGKSIGAFISTCFGTLGATFEPFSDFEAYSKSGQKKNYKNAIYIIMGIAIAIPVTAIAVALLISADVVFKNFSEKIFGSIDFGTIVGVIILYVVGFFMAYCSLTCLSKRGVSEATRPAKKHNALVAITALIAVSLVYVAFSYIQIAYLFVGGMTLPEGYTYAQYVHEGFYQLLFVCIMNLCIVLVAVGCFERNKVLNGLLLVISLCIVVMLASCTFRITMYVTAYGLSVQRFLVYWTLTLIAFLLAGIVVKIGKPSFEFLRYSVVVFCILYTLLAFSKMEYTIADVNLNKLAKNGKEIDYYYLEGLSSDAAPAIYEYMSKEGEKNHPLDRYAERMSEYSLGSWRKYNFSRSRAKELFWR